MGDAIPGDTAASRSPAPGTVAVVTMMGRPATVALYDGAFWRSCDARGPIKCVPAAITSIETPYVLTPDQGDDGSGLPAHVQQAGRDVARAYQAGLADARRLAADPDAEARAERYRLAWLSARRRAGEAAYEADVWRRLAKGGPVAPEDEEA